MLDVDESRFRQWVGLTQQQYDIVKIIYRLRNRGLQPTPKAIQREYKTEHSKYLMKPNLFNLLRLLIQKRIIRKAATADYTLDQEGIEAALKKARQTAESNLQDVEKTSREIDQFFKEITYSRELPDIRYLEDRQIYENLTQSLLQATQIHIMDDFPTTAYTNEVNESLEREEFADSLWFHLKGKKTKINILTTINMDTLFNHCFQTYTDPKTAYREAQTCLNRLQTQIEKHKNLDIRYTDTHPGLDIAVITHKEPNEFYIFTRDEHNNISGGLRIKSHKTAKNALHNLENSMQYATKLNTPEGKAVINEIIQKNKRNYDLLQE
jgi:hypothetical protein